MRPIEPITNCGRGCTRIKFSTMKFLSDSYLGLKEDRPQHQ
jgi:hypothetical protein